MFSKFVKKWRSSSNQPRLSLSSRDTNKNMIMRIKAKLLLPVVTLPDAQPALALLKAGGLEKRKGKTVVYVTLFPEYVELTSQEGSKLTENEESTLKLSYESLVSTDLTKRENEIAFTSKTSNNHYCCVGLKLKVLQGKSRFSKRKITGKELKQLIHSLQYEQEAILPDPAKEISSVHDMSSTLVSQDQEFVDAVESGFHLRKSSRHSIIPHSVSCPLLPTVTSDQNVPVSSISMSANTNLRDSSDFTHIDSTQNMSCCAYNWECNSGYFFLRAVQPSSFSTLPPSTEVINEQCTISPSNKRTGSASSSQSQEDNNDNGGEYYASYLAFLYQLCCVSYLIPSSSDATHTHQTSSTQESKSGSNRSTGNTRPAYYPFEYSSHHLQVRTFQPTVLYREPESHHSPAFPHVNGLYTTSPHLSQADTHSQQSSHTSLFFLESLEDESYSLC